MLGREWRGKYYTYASEKQMGSSFMFTTFTHYYLLFSSNIFHFEIETKTIMNEIKITSMCMMKLNIKMNNVPL